ncbi:MAG TPA: ECF-type sigma factor [Thermoanaerobaculia bacterium]|nr:ECF-type sigma factor [Thermoanaerobaculia bacterium]
MTVPEDEVLELLRSWEVGDPRALAELMPLVCGDLCRLARSLLRREVEGHTLEPSALVSEVYLRLHGLRSARWESRAHFYNFVVRLMRQILADHARTAGRRKRGREVQHLPLETAVDQAAVSGDEQRALNDALLDLRRIDPQGFRIIALRYFVGLTAEETAAACGVSLSTVKRDWCEARIWLRRALTDNALRKSAPC